MDTNPTSSFFQRSFKPKNLAALARTKSGSGAAVHAPPVQFSSCEVGYILLLLVRSASSVSHTFSASHIPSFGRRAAGTCGSFLSTSMFLARFDQHMSRLVPHPSQLSNELAEALAARRCCGLKRACAMFALSKHLDVL